MLLLLPSKFYNILFLSIPDPRLPAAPNLPMKLKDTIHESLGSRRAPRNINIDWKNTVNSPYDAVAVVIVASAVGARSHADDPAWLGHLIVDLPESRGHFVCDGSCYYHHVCLSWRGSKEDSKTFLIISWH
jgi:hypothetical protein